MTQPLLLLESPWAGIIILSPYKNSEDEIIDFVIEQFNSTAQKQFAYLDIGQGKKFSKVFPLGEDILSMYRNVLESRTSIEYKVCLPQEDRDVWWRNRCFVYNNGSLILISENITAVNTQEADQQHKNALLQKIFDLSYDTFWILKSIRNPQGELIDFSIEYINKIAKETFPQLTTSTILSKCFPATFIEHFYKLRKVVDTGEGYTEDIFFPHDGINEWLRERVYKFDDGVLVTQDFITEDKVKEAQLRSLTQRNEELDTFVYTASHDLNSPLNNIESLINFLAEDIQSKSQNTEVYIGLLNKSITQLKSTLKDLTTVTEIHPDETKELVDLKEVIEEVKVALYKQIEEAEATIQVDLNSALLTIPKKHARSLVYNLLSNALKFRSSDRKLLVTISCYLEGDKVCIRFCDNGIGIKEADQAKVFMIFKRLNYQVAGRGVGMYLVKRIVVVNGGDIKLQSKENVGTVFQVEFPIAH